MDFFGAQDTILKYSSIEYKSKEPLLNRGAQRRAAATVYDSNYGLRVRM